MSDYQSKAVDTLQEIVEKFAALRAELNTARAKIAALEAKELTASQKIMTREEWRALSPESRHKCNLLALRAEQLEAAAKPVIDPEEICTDYGYE